MRPHHELASVAHSMLLDLVPVEREIPLSAVVGRLDRLVLEVRLREPSFDFGYWARGTIAEVIAYLAGTGMLMLYGVTGDQLLDLDMWPRVALQRTLRGSSFIEATRRTQADLFAQIEAGAQRASATA